MIDRDDGALSRLFEEARLPAACEQTIRLVHEPLARAILERLEARRGPLCVGLCGPQGSGKTTGAAVLKCLIQEAGFRCAVLALDDLYLTLDDRRALSKTTHPLLITRGPPGTHDPGLGLDLLDRLGRRGRTPTPFFDKAIDDRVPRARWPVVLGPAGVIIFEGWCVGARPQDVGALATPINRLEAEFDGQAVWRRYVNEALAGRYQDLFARIGFLVMLRPPNFEVIFKWRLEQEEKLREARRHSGGGAHLLSADQISWFIQHYERVARHLDAEMPGRADAVVTLNEGREPVAIRIGRHEFTGAFPPKGASADRTR